MNNDSQNQPELPVWTRVDLFPAKPKSAAAYGLRTTKGKEIACETLDELISAFRKNSTDLVWTPASEHFVVPEEIPALLERVREKSLANAVEDFKSARTTMIFLSVLVLWGALPAINAVMKGQAPVSILFQGNGGMYAVLLVMFGCMPMYAAWKSQRAAKVLDAESMEATAKEIRFELWLQREFPRITLLLLVVIGIVYVLQMKSPQLVEMAGLQKLSYHAGQTWRLLTAPLLHGNFAHVLMNASSLWVLGRRVEALAKWPHLLLVFLVSMIGGGMASALFTKATSVGASGGIMGLLGFLIVFETLHKKLVPKSSRRRLIGGVIGMGVIGLVGFQFIDNGAHAGGLFAGMLYALIVFPSSSSAQRPKMTNTDLIAGIMAAAILLYGFALILKIGF